VKVATGKVGNFGKLHLDWHLAMNTKRRLISLSAVKKESVTWLWRDRIALGEITLLDGDPGQIKSTAGVVLIQAEDSLGGRVKPTLIAAGADMKRVRLYDRKRFQEEPIPDRRPPRRDRRPAPATAVATPEEDPL